MKATILLAVVVATVVVLGTAGAQAELSYNMTAPLFPQGLTFSLTDNVGIINTNYLQFYIQPRDENGANITDASGLQVVTSFMRVNGSSPVNFFVEGIFMPGSGMYLFVVNTTIAGSYYMTFTIDSEPLMNNYTINLFFTCNPGIPDFTQSSVSANVMPGTNASLYAGEGSIFISVNMLDIFGNRITATPQAISMFSVIGIPFPSTLPSPTPITMALSNGQPSNNVKWVFTINVLGNYKMEAILLATSQTWFSSPLVQITPGSLVTQNSLVNVASVNNTLATTTPIATARTIYFTPRDQFNNSITPTYSLNYIQATFTQKFPLICKFVGSIKTYTFTMFTPTAPPGSPQPTAFQCVISGITVADHYLLTVVDAQNTVNGPYDVFINANFPSGANCIASGFATTYYNYTQPSTFNVAIHDAYNNKVTSAEGVAAFRKNAKVNLVPASNTSSVISLPHIDETMNITGNIATIPMDFMQIRVSGVLLVNVYYLSQNISSSASGGASGTGSIITVHADTDGRNSVARGDGLYNCQASSVCRLVVQTRDFLGANQTIGGDTVVAQFKNDGVVASVSSDNNGFYEISYTITGPGSHQLSVTVNGQELVGSPYPVNVTLSNAAIGLIVVAVILFVVFGAIIGYVIYRRRQIKRLQREWALKKAAAYREYQMGAGAEGQAPTLAGLKKRDEPEWDDEKEFRTQPAQNSTLEADGEWSFMQSWVNSDVKTAPQQGSSAGWDDSDELDALKNAAKRKSGAASSIGRNSMFKSGN